MTKLVVKRKQEVPLEQICIGDEIILLRVGEIVDDVDAQGFSTVSKYDSIAPRQITRRRYSHYQGHLKSKRGRTIGTYDEGSEDYARLNKIIERWR